MAAKVLPPECVVPHCAFQDHAGRMAPQSPNKEDKVTLAAQGAGSRVGWEALLPELKSVPSFLNNGPGLSLALLHTPPPKLPLPLMGCWGPLSWMPRSWWGEQEQEGRKKGAGVCTACKAPTCGKGAIPRGQSSRPGLAAQAPRRDGPFCRGQMMPPLLPHCPGHYFHFLSLSFFFKSLI